MEVSASDDFAPSTATFGEGEAEDGGVAVAGSLQAPVTVTVGSSEGEVAREASPSSSSAATAPLMGNSSLPPPQPPPEDAENHIQEPILSKLPPQKF